MRGTMIWFNADKGHGFIRTEDDERLIVHEDGFADGEIPVGKCAGTDVSFERETIGDEARAINVASVPMVNARRARRRGYQLSSKTPATAARSASGVNGF